MRISDVISILPKTAGKCWPNAPHGGLTLDQHCTVCLIPGSFCEISRLPCRAKPKGSIILICKVSRYCLLALQSSADIYMYISHKPCLSYCRATQ